MFVSLQRKEQPDVGAGDHWEMFRIFQEHTDLFAALRTSTIEAVEAIVTANANPVIESSRLGAQILGGIGSWWHGEFPRRLPNFPNGSESGIFGMALWNYLSARTDWWCFAEQEDSHGYGWNSMRYWQLPAGHTLIPR